MQSNTTTKNNNEIKSAKIDKSVNELIPELILKINKYSSKLKERVKLYSIFREFDTYAHVNLQSFIKLSDNRYRNIKSGNNLRNVLINQKKAYDELSSKILTSNLYNDKNIEREEENLCKKVDHKDNRELYQIRHSIIKKTKDLSKKELKRREKFLILSTKSRNQRLKDKNQTEEKNKNKNIFSNKTLYGSLRGRKLISKSMNANFHQTFGNNNLKNNDNNVNSLDSSLLNNDTKSQTFNMVKFYKEKDVLKSKKELIENLFKTDNKNINDQILDYKLFLNKIRNSGNDNFTRIFNSGNNPERTYSFNLDDVKLLSYKEEQQETKKIKKKEHHEIDMKTLVKYTKRGNRKWFLNNIKELSQKRQNSFREKMSHKKHIYNNTYKTSHISTAAIKKSKSDNNIFDNQNNEKTLGSIDNNNIDTMEKTNYTTFSNFRNTIKTVKNEANNIRKIGQNFDIKRRTMSEFFSRMNLPEIKEYGQEAYKTRNNFLKINNKKIDKFSKTYNIQEPPKTTTQKINVKSSLKIGHNNSKKNVKDDKFISPKIFADLLQLYNDKKKIWQKEDFMKETIKKEKLSHIARTKKYLDEMEHFKRKPHLFIDPYSRRDELINNRIKLLTRSLSGPIYSQKKFQNKIDEFNNFIEQKEKEIISNNKIMAETLKKEQSKSMEKDAEAQIKQKMKKNFEKEEKNKNKNDDDIKLNYKFIATLKATKKKHKNRSYQDYQEFLEIVKDKQRKGLYDVNKIKDVTKK